MPRRPAHRLLSNPWIAQAAVLKLYPDRLRIEIKERKAFALWQKDGRVNVIAADGTVLETYVPERFTSLPLVVGGGAEHAAQDILDLLKRYPAIAKSVDASILVAERRWNLHLKSGLDVLLPEREPAHALARWSTSIATRSCCRATSSTVDLRLVRPRHRAAIRRRRRGARRGAQGGRERQEEERREATHDRAALRPYAQR